MKPHGKRRRESLYFYYPKIDAPARVAPDDALDAEHDKEADAALRKWREAAGALPAPVRPRPKQPKLKIDVDRKAASHVVFGGGLEGMDVVKAVEKVGSGGGKTTKTVEITDSGELEMPALRHLYCPRFVRSGVFHDHVCVGFLGGRCQRCRWRRKLRWH